MGDLDVYFVANQLDSSINSECLFRAGEKTPEIWDPENGNIVKPVIFRMEKGIVRIPFNFKPFHLFCLFSDQEYLQILSPLCPWMEERYFLHRQVKKKLKFLWLHLKKMDKL